jgi:RNA polymerase sigma-70 factor (ECF subfamily)
MEHDAELVRKATDGEAPAFAVLYDRYVRVIRAVCFETTGEINAAQELAQEVFLRAYAKLRTLRKPERFGPWIVSIARYVCCEWRRGRKRDRHRFVVHIPESGVQVHDEVSETAVRVWAALARLPEQERLALHLFYLADESANAARDVLGLSHSGFYKLLNRAKERLAALLRRERNEEEAV